MTNNETMNLNLKRIDVCDISLALSSIIKDFKNEINNEDTTEERREIAKRSIIKWEKLHEEVKKQLKEFDGQQQ